MRGAAAPKSHTSPRFTAGGGPISHSEVDTYSMLVDNTQSIDFYPIHAIITVQY